jgi:hypothetical protein
MTFYRSFFAVRWHAPLMFSLLFLIGCWYWVSLFTDFSLVGTIPDLLFPPLAAGIALAAFRQTASIRHNLHGWFYRAACLPVLLGGLAYAVTAVLVCANLLGMMFIVSEMASEEEIAQVASPSAWQVAHVYFQGVGAYTGGDGRIFIRIQYPYLPLIERDVYYIHSYFGQDVQVSWQDDDTIVVQYDQAGATDVIKLGSVKPETPLALGLLEYMSQSK